LTSSIRMKMSVLITEFWWISYIELWIMQLLNFVLLIKTIVNWYSLFFKVFSTRFLKIILLKTFTEPDLIKRAILVWKKMLNQDLKNKNRICIITIDSKNEVNTADNFLHSYLSVLFYRFVFFFLFKMEFNSLWMQ